MVADRVGTDDELAGGAKTTKAQAIYEAMLADIEVGRLQPGRPLDEVEMAALYGASRTPVREAIRRLELTGLVATRSHRGAVVVGLTEAQLDETFAVLAELEALAARWATFAMTEAEKRDLQAVHASAWPLVQADDWQAYADANVAFHEAIYRGSHNGTLADLARVTTRRAAPYRRAQFQEAGRLARSHAEHASVAEAILTGDAVGAETLMREHLTVVRSAVDSVYAPAAEPRGRTLAR